MGIIVVFALGVFAVSKTTDRNAYATLWDAIADLPDPEQCALCGEGMRHHAPCLINLSTGQMGEMTVYTPHPSRQGEIAPMEMQQTGTFNFQPCAGLMAIRDTCTHACIITLPEKRELMNPALFCRECRQLLAEAGLEGYVILDLYNLDDVRAYPIQGETIRDYRISVTVRPEHTIDFCVEGLLK